MKKRITLLCIVLSHFALAEYNGWYIDFTIETKNQEVIKGHGYIASAYFDKDSSNNDSYVTKRLMNLIGNGNDTLIYFKDRITYTYTPYESYDVAEIYTLVNNGKIAFNTIAYISIDTMIDYWYLSNIATSHALADTIWMKNAPAQTVVASGYLCSWEIFIHEETVQTKQILAELIKSQALYDKIIKNLEDEEDYNGSEAYREAKERMSEFEDSIDEITAEILSKFEGQKVVIISFCSC